MIQVLKYLVVLNSCLALASWGGIAWVAQRVGSQAYVAGALATIVVGSAASFALLLTYVQSLPKNEPQNTNNKPNNNNAVSGVLLAMLIRMGLPLLAVVFMKQIKSPLLNAGFFDLLTLNYLVALPLETTLSLRFLRTPKVSPAKVSINKK